MPKSCKDCPCRSNDDDGIIRTCQLETNDEKYIVLTEEMWDEERPASCPLYHISERDKEIAELIRGMYARFEDLERILDKVVQDERR